MYYITFDEDLELQRALELSKDKEKMEYSLQYVISGVLIRNWKEK